MVELLIEPAGWGAAGAFIYGAPRLSACLSAPETRRAACVFEFFVTLIIGAIGAAAFGPWIATWRGMKTSNDLNAICAVVGLLANPTAPVLLSLAPKMANTILAALKGPSA